MEQQTIVLEEYNQEATKGFIIDAIKGSSLPIFYEINRTKDWVNAYKVLSLFKTHLPDLVNMYNRRYLQVITINN